MKEYVCSQCGRRWFSAAELKSLEKPYCEECGGKLKEMGKTAVGKEAETDRREV